LEIREMTTSAWREQMVEIDGARMHVVRSGKGEKPPVVLVHGFSDSAQCWPQLASDLRDEYDVVMPDARGHGHSARVRPEEPVDLAADLAGVIRALALDRPAVVGHSMGARTASQLGARFLELVRALVLEDPPWRPTVATEAPSSTPPSDAEVLPSPHPMQAWVDRLQEMSVDEIVAQSRPEHPAWPDDVLRRWSAAKRQLDPNFLRRGGLRSTGWTEIVDALQCPTLLITASPDQGSIVTPELAREVTRRNQHIRLHHIDGVGHHIRFAAYDRYAAEVLPFLKQVM
jgi:pimeloyl-ACP methyl ester carboxylesterase